MIDEFILENLRSGRSSPGVIKKVIERLKERIEVYEATLQKYQEEAK